MTYILYEFYEYHKLLFSFLRPSCLSFIDLDGYVRFIAKPDDPSYVKKGRTVKLVWDYKPYDQPTTIVLSVAVQNTYVPLLAKQNGSVTYSPNTPSAYMGRVKLEGRATMVIYNVSSQDSFAFFQCELVPSDSSAIQLILMGMYSSFEVFEFTAKLTI